MLPISLLSSAFRCFEIIIHIGRHTFATLLASNPNVSLFTLRELLGHSDIRITQEYVKVANTDKIKAINILNSL